MMRNANTGRLLLNDLDDQPIINENAGPPLPMEKPQKFKLPSLAAVFSDMKVLKCALLIAIAIILLLTMVIIALATKQRSFKSTNPGNVCPNLVLNNGEVQYFFNAGSKEDAFPPGTVANITCPHHRATIQGSSTRFCTTNGTWSGNSASCLTPVFLIGGYSGASDHDQVTVFYPEQPNKSYNMSSRLKTARDGHLAFKSEAGRIFVVGGHGTTALADTEIFDTKSQRWLSGQPMPNPVATAVGGLIGDKYYVCGGYEKPFVARNDCFVYQVPENSWSESTPMNSERKYSCSFVLQNKFYVIGGVNLDKSLLNSVEVFDSNMNEWTYAHSFPIAIQDCGATAFDGRGYVCGGRNVSKQLKECYVYDPGSDSWAPFINMNESREDFQMTSANNRIYAILGEKKGVRRSGLLSNTIEWIQPGTDHVWSTLPDMGKLLGMRELFAIA